MPGRMALRHRAAIGDLAKIVASGRTPCRGEIVQVAGRYSDNPHERDELLAWLSSQVPPTG